MAPVTLDVVPHRDVFVPFELPLSELEPGWYTLVCDVDVDGSPATYDGGRRFSVPWPRATVRRGAVKVGREVKLEDATVHVEQVDCSGDSIKVHLRVEPASEVTLKLFADGRRLQVLELELDEADGTGQGDRVPVDADRRVPARRASRVAARVRKPRSTSPSRSASCRWRGIASARAGPVARRAVPQTMCGLRIGTVAVLRRVSIRARGPVAAVVRAMRGAGGTSGRRVPGLPARRDRDRPRAVRVRRTDPSCDPPAEVRGMARRRRRARGRDGRGVGRRRWTPSAVTWVPLSRERLAARGYDQARALARAVAPRLGRAGRAAGPSSRRPGPAGPPRGGRPARGDARGVRGRGRLGPGRARRRRAHHGRHRRGVRERAARGRRPGGRAAHGGPSGFLGAAAPAYTRPRARVRVCGCPGEPIPGSRCQPRAKRPT